MDTTSGRLLTLLSLLQARRDWPGQVLADRLEVSPRTVRRDVERLREMGYRIGSSKGPDGGYRLDAGEELPPLLFDDEQAVAIAIALEAAPMSGVEIGDGAARALATLRQLMPARLRHRLGAVRATAVPRSPGSGVDTDVLVAVSAAVRAHEVLRFDHETPGDDGPPRAPRRVEPHHVVARAGRWYLVAWDLDRTDWRTFRVDRMAPRIPNGPRFAPRELPGGDAAAFVAARFRGSAASDTWPCTGEVVLDLPARDVLAFLPDATVEEVAAGRSRVVAGSWSWVGLAASLARFDAPITVVGPPALADAFATLSRRFGDAARGATH